MKKILLFVLAISSFGVNAQFWTQKATGFTTPQRILNSIAIVDANVIWANAIDNSTPLEPNYTIKEFTRSTDGGNTWTPGTLALGANTTDLGISSITAFSASTAWISAYPDVIGTSNLGGIWKTTDSGSTWFKQTTASFNGVRSYTNFVYFWNDNDGIAQGDPEGNEFEIYTTNDGGTTWIRVPAANIPDPNPLGGEYGYFNNYSVSGNTIWFGTDKGRIFKSIDKGLNWTVAQSPSSDLGFDKFTFSDENKGLLTTYSTPILLFKTVDGGANWNPVTTTGILNTDITYIPGTSKVIAVDRAKPFGSSYSLDDGSTWTFIDDIPHGLPVFLNESFGFSAGENTDANTGGIFKYTGLQLFVPSFAVKKQISAYPNPTKGILQIDSETQLIKEASIFDLLGRQLSTFQFSALSKVDLDLKSLQSGLYLLKVTSDAGNTETLKIIKD
jgi:photosystem II stability/assembly factor-like uncharacterized protein